MSATEAAAETTLAERPKVEETPQTETTTETPAPTAEPTTAPAPTSTETPKEATEESKPSEAVAEAPVTEEAPKPEAKPALSGPVEQLFEKLPAILKDASHTEMWGVELKDSSDIPTSNVLKKFLRANTLNVEAAATQLKKALKWRKEYNPTSLVKDVKFDEKKFGSLGYITEYETKAGNVVVTWNIYGAAAKQPKVTFGDVNEFVKWRSALMELAVQKLKLAEATTEIPLTVSETEIDPYQMIQVHDYLDVSFLRPDPTVKAATKSTIEVLSTAYPELLREKFFVNVPAIMGWMFAAVKLFVSKETVRKFHPIANGANLAKELDFGEKVPVAYGGKGEALVKTGEQLPMTAAETPAETKTTEASKIEETKVEETKVEETKTDAAVELPAETKTETPAETAPVTEPEVAPAAEVATDAKPATTA